MAFRWLYHSWIICIVFLTIGSINHTCVKNKQDGHRAICLCAARYGFVFFPPPAAWLIQACHLLNDLFVWTVLSVCVFVCHLDTGDFTHTYLKKKTKRNKSINRQVVFLVHCSKTTTWSTNCFSLRRYVKEAILLTQNKYRRLPEHKKGIIILRTN